MPTASSSPYSRPTRPKIAPPPTTSRAPRIPNRTAVFRPLRTPCMLGERLGRALAFPRPALDASPRIAIWLTALHVGHRPPAACERDLRQDLRGRPSSQAQAAPGDRRL